MDSALYATTFAGKADFGGGAVYIGNGKVSGMDVGSLRYRGTYIEKDGRLRLDVL